MQDSDDVPIRANIEPTFRGLIQDKRLLITRAALLLRGLPDVLPRHLPVSPQIFWSHPKLAALFLDKVLVDRSQKKRLFCLPPVPWAELAKTYSAPRVSLAPLREQLHNVSVAPMRLYAPHIEISKTDARLPAPSHVLAVYASADGRLATAPPPPGAEITLVAVHKHVLAASSSAVPFPRRATSDDERAPGPRRRTHRRSSPARILLPAVPLGLPSPPTYALVQELLYHASGPVPTLITAVFPESARWEPRMGMCRAWLVDRFARYGCAAASVRPRARLLHGVWANVVVLGINIESLWDCVTMLWGALVLIAEENGMPVQAEARRD